MRPLIVGWVLLLPAPVAARTDEESWPTRKPRFKQGVDHKDRLLQSRKYFSRSADAYLDLHKRGMRAPALYRNLGNAAVLADRWPEAIWAYHTGLKIDPTDRAMREHLAFVRAKVIYPSSGQGRPDADVWPIWLHRPTLYEFLGVAPILYTCLCIALACFW